MQDPFVVHCHMPKTAGSALNRRLLFPRFGVERVHLLYRFVFERTSRLPLRHRGRAMRCFAAAGHVPFGYVDAVYPGAIYVSLFRDPVARFVSFLNFMLETDDHKARARLPGAVLARAAEDPDALVRAVLAEPMLAAIHANTQTRLASGSARLGTHPVDGRHLQAALVNIANPRYLTGLHEDFDAVLAHFDRMLPGAPRTPSDRGRPDLEKQGTRAICPTALAPATVSALRAANDLDLALIEAVSGRQPNAPPSDRRRAQAA